jgi:hypothetical protein
MRNLWTGRGSVSFGEVLILRRGWLPLCFWWIENRAAQLLRGNFVVGCGAVGFDVDEEVATRGHYDSRRKARRFINSTVRSFAQFSNHLIQICFLIHLDFLVRDENLESIHEFYIPGFLLIIK